jgi:hypothetical protein
VPSGSERLAQVPCEIRGIDQLAALPGAGAIDQTLGQIGNIAGARVSPSFGTPLQFADVI